jgi:hypothetical protein
MAIDDRIDPDYEPRLYDADGKIYNDQGKEIRWHIEYRVWDWNKQKFVRKLYRGMNKHKSVRARRKAANDSMLELKALLKEGIFIGQAPDPDIIQRSKIDLAKYTLKQACIAFLNFKNSTHSEQLPDTYNGKLAKVSEGTFRITGRPFAGSLTGWTPISFRICS